MRLVGDGTNSVRSIITGIPVNNRIEFGFVNGMRIEGSEHSQYSIDLDNFSELRDISNTVITASSSNWRNTSNAEDIGVDSVIIRSTYRDELDMSSPFGVEINTTYSEMDNTVEEFPILINSFNSSELHHVANGGNYYKLVLKILDYYIKHQIRHEINTLFDGNNMIVNLDIIIQLFQ